MMALRHQNGISLYKENCTNETAITYTVECYRYANRVDHAPRIRSKGLVHLTGVVVCIRAAYTLQISR